MIQIAQRLSRIRPSAMMVISQTAREMRARGIDVLDLGMGEPDFATPPHIIEAAHQAALSGQTHYTPTQGTLALRQAVAQKFLAENGLTFTPDQVIISTGAKQVIFDAMAATLNPGDEVILPVPSWGSYVDIVRTFDGEPVMVPCHDDTGFLLTPEALEAAITPKTRWIFLNAPSNPTGGMYSSQQYQALAAVLARHPDIMILSDEIYEHIVFDGTFVAFAAACPDLAPRTLTVNGVSKAYAMTGWRIGYGAGPAELIRAMITVQSQITSGTSSVSQAAAVAALTGPQDCVETFRQAFRVRRDLVVRHVAAMNGLTLQSPPGAFYAYMGCEGLIGRKTPGGQVIATDADAARYILEQGRVALVPGAAFGLSPFLRMSLASADDVLDEACRRMAGALAQLA